MYPFERKGFFHSADWSHRIQKRRNSTDTSSTAAVQYVTEELTQN